MLPSPPRSQPTGASCYPPAAAFNTPVSDNETRTMPNKRAALRQMRKDRWRALRNHAVISELRTLTKRFRSFLAQQNREEATRLLPLLMHQFDRAASKGMIHKNAASRTKSRLMRQLAKGPQTASSGTAR